MSEWGGRHVVLGRSGVRTTWPVRTVAMLRGLWGAVLLARARSLVATLEPGLRGSAAAPWVVRVLGGRHVGQAAVTTARPSRWVAWLGAGADLLHGLTALLYAASGRSRRRAGLTSAGVAMGFGAASVLAARPQMVGGERRPRTPGDTGEELMATHESGKREAAVSTEDDTVSTHGEERSDAETGRVPQVPEQRSRAAGTAAPASQQHAGPPGGEGAARRRAASKETLVRPRIMWTGVALALLGMAFIALAMILMWGWWVWAGVGVLAVGLLVAWRGGALNDVQSGTALSQELQEAAKGGTHHGVAAGQQIQDRSAQEHALATTERTEQILAARRNTSVPVSPAASIVLLALGVWIFVGTFVIPHAYTNVGQNSALRDLGFAIVVTLSALWLRNVGPNRVVSGIVVLMGVLMVLSAFLLPHDSLAVAVDDGLTGAFVIIAGLLSTVRSGTAD